MLHIQKLIQPSNDTRVLIIYHPLLKALKKIIPVSLTYMRKYGITVKLGNKELFGHPKIVP